mgnify:FL=1
MKKRNIFPKAKIKLGSLLLADPFEKDPRFKHSVVLLTEYDEEGALGFIMNKPTGISVSEAVDDFPYCDSLLYFGGPEETESLFYVHTVGEMLDDSIEIIPGLWHGGDYDKLRMLLDTNQIGNDQIRFYVGYTEWAPGALDFEVKKKYWIVSNVNNFFPLHDSLRGSWEKVLKSMGQEYAILANFPEDPNLN